MQKADYHDKHGVYNIGVRLREVANLEPEYGFRKLQPVSGKGGEKGCDPWREKGPVCPCEVLHKPFVQTTSVRKPSQNGESC